MTGRGRSRRVRPLVLSAVVVVGVLSSACTGSGAARGGTASTGSSVRQVASISTLRDAFNADAGATRLILLVSPT